MYIRVMSFEARGNSALRNAGIKVGWLGRMRCSINMAAKSNTEKKAPKRTPNCRPTRGVPLITSGGDQTRFICQRS